MGNTLQEKNHKVINTNKYLNKVFRSVKKVYFNKQLSRYTDEKSHIPSFMQVK